MRNKKLQRGSIYLFEDVLEKAQTYQKVTEEGMSDEFLRNTENVFLVKWLYPESNSKALKDKAIKLKKGRYPSFHNSFLEPTATSRKSESGSSKPTSTRQPVQVSNSGRG